MKTADLKALAAGTELFYCRSNRWNTGNGQNGTRVLIVNATSGHWRFNEDTEAWERRPVANKYGSYKMRTEHGILVRVAGGSGKTFVVPSAHIRGVYSACQEELSALREMSISQYKYQQELRARQADLRDAIRQEFGLKVGVPAGFDSTTVVVDTEDLLKLLRELAHAAQQ